MRRAPWLSLLYCIFAIQPLFGQGILPVSDTVWVSFRLHDLDNYRVFFIGDPSVIDYQDSVNYIVKCDTPLCNQWQILDSGRFQCLAPCDTNAFAYVERDSDFTYLMTVVLSPTVRIDTLFRSSKGIRIDWISEERFIYFSLRDSLIVAGFDEGPFSWGQTWPSVLEVRKLDKNGQFITRKVVPANSASFTPDFNLILFQDCILLSDYWENPESHCSLTTFDVKSESTRTYVDSIGGIASASSRGKNKTIYYICKSHGTQNLAALLPNGEVKQLTHLEEPEFVSDYELVVDGQMRQILVQIRRDLMADGPTRQEHIDEVE